MVGFFTGSAVIGILVSQFLAGRSDRQGDRKQLIVVCCLLGCWPAYSLPGTATISFCCSSAFSQQLWIDRQPADVCPRAGACRQDRPRSGDVQLHFTCPVSRHGDWSPLAYAPAMGFGFTAMYLSAAAAFIVCGIMVWLFLPSMRKAKPVATGRLEAPRTHRRDALLLFSICTLMWGTNSLYIINMPLFIINELHLPEKLAGLMMGTAAGLEIPTMLIAGYYARRFGKRFLMRLSAVAGCCFTSAC